MKNKLRHDPACAEIAIGPDFTHRRPKNDSKITKPTGTIFNGRVLIQNAVRKRPDPTQHSTAKLGTGNLRDKIQYLLHVRSKRRCITENERKPPAAIKKARMRLASHSIVGP